MCDAPRNPADQLAAFVLDKVHSRCNHSCLDEYLEDLIICHEDIVFVRQSPYARRGVLQCTLHNFEAGIRRDISQSELYALLETETPAYFIQDATQKGDVHLVSLAKSRHWPSCLPTKRMLVLSDGRVVGASDKVASPGMNRSLTVDGKSVSYPSTILHALYGMPPTSEHTSDHINGTYSDNSCTNLRWASKSEQACNQKRKSRRPPQHYTEFGYTREDLEEYFYGGSTEPNRVLLWSRTVTEEHREKLVYFQPIFNAKSGNILGSFSEHGVGGDYHTTHTLAGVKGSYIGHRIVFAASMCMPIREFTEWTHTKKLVVRHLRGTPHACSIHELELGTQSQNSADIPEEKRGKSRAKRARTLLRQAGPIPDLEGILSFVVDTAHVDSILKHAQAQPGSTTSKCNKQRLFEEEVIKSVVDDLIKRVSSE